MILRDGTLTVQRHRTLGLGRISRLGGCRDRRLPKSEGMGGAHGRAFRRREGTPRT